MIPDLVISIISSDNEDQLMPCLESIFTSNKALEIEVYVVDNASKGNLVEKVVASYPQVTIIRNETKLGFSTNNNLVLSRGNGRYLMLLNDDTIVKEGALDSLVSFMDDNAEVDAVGATLLNADGTNQPAHAAFPHPLLEAIWPVINWYHYLNGHRSQPFEVDSVCGAALVVRQNVLETVGMLDTRFDPIYSEEVDWCYRIKSQGGLIYSLPAATVIHYGSQTMDKVVPEKYGLLWEHKHFFFEKHYGKRAATLYKSTLLITTAIKYFLWTLGKLVWPVRDRALSQAELHRYLLSRVSQFK